MTQHLLETTTIIAEPIEEVFAFFSKAENLNELTPPELNFRIITPLPIKMEQGTVIDYTIGLYGIPMRWKTLISVWEPPFRFVDEQIKGPYRKWIHEHRFEREGDQTKMIDNLQFLSPGGIAEPLINWLFVEKKVKAIFEFRERRLQEIFTS